MRHHNIPWDSGIATSWHATWLPWASSCGAGLAAACFLVAPAGFPVTSADARHKFYLYANWTYQAGNTPGAGVTLCLISHALLLHASNRWLKPASPVCASVA